MKTSTPGIRHRGFADFGGLDPELRDGNRHWLMRAQNFWLEWIEMAHDPVSAGFEVHSLFESMLLVLNAAVRVVPADPGRAPAQAAAHSLCILPPGCHAVSAAAGAVCVSIASARSDLAGRRCLGQEAYVERDPRICPTGQPYRRHAGDGVIRVLDIDAIAASPDRPRLKMIQTDTLSINIVEYDGPRDRRALSPHAHADCEQGSLAVEGDFVHHLRVPWGSDSNLWRDDEHLQAGSPSLLVVPVGMVHTTEGVGEGRHMLLDVFSPPRRDFIDSGWVFNSRDYEAADPAGGGAR